MHVLQRAHRNAERWYVRWPSAVHVLLVQTHTYQVCMPRTWIRCTVRSMRQLKRDGSPDIVHPSAAIVSSVLLPTGLLVVLQHPGHRTDLQGVALLGLCCTA